MDVHVFALVQASTGIGTGVHRIHMERAITGDEGDVDQDKSRRWRAKEQQGVRNNKCQQGG
jgi:hypothetical protein